MRIDDHLLAAAKRRARTLGLTLEQLIEEALRRELSRDEVPDTAGPPVPTFREGTGPRPGVDVTSTRTLLEPLDEGRPLERVR